MESLREFLESSTIHGLVYISVSKQLVIKVVWTCIVIIAFMVAVNLIFDAFVEWDESPVGTSEETHPIYTLDFPKVTVCPPKGSHTALNVDLIRAENGSIKIAKEILDQMKLAADRLVEERESWELMVEAREFYEENKFKNWYNGVSKVVFPYETLNLPVSARNYLSKIMSNGFNPNLEYFYGHYMFTSATSGSVHTPWFGQTYDEDIYLNGIDYRIRINIPKGLPNGTKLVVSGMIDTMEIEGGDEDVALNSLGTASNYETFKETGLIRVTRKIDINQYLTLPTYLGKKASEEDKVEPPSISTSALHSGRKKAALLGSIGETIGGLNNIFGSIKDTSNENPIAGLLGQQLPVQPDLPPLLNAEIPGFPNLDLVQLLLNPVGFLKNLNVPFPLTQFLPPNLNFTEILRDPFGFLTSFDWLSLAENVLSMFDEDFLSPSEYMDRRFGGLEPNLFIIFYRIMDPVTLQLWNNKRMTGFNLTWHYEDMDGKRIKDMSNENNINYRKENELFIKWINAVQDKDPKFLWEKIKEIRPEFVLEHYHETRRKESKLKTEDNNNVKLI